MISGRHSFVDFAFRLWRCKFQRVPQPATTVASVAGACVGATVRVSQTIHCTATLQVWQLHFPERESRPNVSKSQFLPALASGQSLAPFVVLRSHSLLARRFILAAFMRVEANHCRCAGRDRQYRRVPVSILIHAFPVERHRRRSRP